MKNPLFLFHPIALLAVTVGITACEADDESFRGDGQTPDTDAGADSDSDADGDADSDTDTDAGTGGSGALDPSKNCDCSDIAGDTAEDFARALNICGDGILADIEPWSSSPNPLKGYAMLESMGNNDCIVKQHGCQMIALSTGPVGQPNPNECTGMEFGDGMGGPAKDPLPPFQGDSASNAQKKLSCDVLQLKLTLKAPPGAEGFSFDFLYASAEFDEWINQGFNDTFYAILEYEGLNGGEPTNISFDDNGNEIEVDTNFFENQTHPCNEAGSGWGTAVSGKSGSTGWLRTSWPVKSGSTFKLTFSIHDEGDCVFDSIVFIDNFQWLGDVKEPGTAPV